MSMKYKSYWHKVLEQVVFVVDVTGSDEERERIYNKIENSLRKLNEEIGCWPQADSFVISAPNGNGSLIKGGLSSFGATRIGADWTEIRSWDDLDLRRGDSTLSPEYLKLESSAGLSLAHAEDFARRHPGFESESILNRMRGDELSRRARSDEIYRRDVDSGYIIP